MRRLRRVAVLLVAIAFVAQQARATICYAIPTPKVRAMCGWVTDRSCQPIIGVQVVVSKAENGKQQVVATVATDASGYFDVSGLKPGTY